MGKQKEKYMVLREVSKDWIESCGAERKLRRIWKLYAIALLIILTGTLVTSRVDVGISSDAIGKIAIALLLCLYVLSAIPLWMAGKKYFKEIKDGNYPLTTCN